MKSLTQRTVNTLSIVAASLIAVLASPLQANGAEGARKLSFDVFLDDRAIGYQRFSLTPAGDATRIETQARFEVKLLRITAFAYDHRNTELWRGGCLRSIDAATDSNGKKVRFVAHVVRALGLANVDAVHSRAEAFVPPQPFDTVVARAFAPLPTLVEWVAPLCSPHTRVLAMKGRALEQERAGLPPGWVIERDEPVEVPGLGEERRVVVLRPPPAGSVG